MPSKKNQKEKKIPDYKIRTVEKLVEKIKKSRTTLIASTKNLPSSQFHSIKKNLRGKAEVLVAKKSLVIRALSSVGKATLLNLENYVQSDVALFFSELDPFALSAFLSDNQSPMKAKAGDKAPEDIVIEPGPTDLPPGPAISELSGVGLKVAVEGGKLAIKNKTTIVHEGDIIKDNVASVMGKLDIFPMKVGFEPIAAYDAESDKIYSPIKIDKKKTLEELRDSISRALSFAVQRVYITKETLSYFFAKASREENALANLILNSSNLGISQDTNVKEGS